MAAPRPNIIPSRAFINRKPYPPIIPSRNINPQFHSVTGNERHSPVFYPGRNPVHNPPSQPTRFAGAASGLSIRRRPIHIENTDTSSSSYSYITNQAQPLEIPTDDRFESYEWKIAGFTDCSRTCGGGFQQTKIVCVKIRSQVTVTAENCNHTQVPTQQEVSCNADPCPPSWETGNWSACSTTCGPGTQKRSIECTQTISRGTKVSTYYFIPYLNFSKLLWWVKGFAILWYIQVCGAYVTWTKQFKTRLILAVVSNIGNLCFMNSNWDIAPQKQSKIFVERKVKVQLIKVK